jgi:hypothetical protein
MQTRTVTGTCRDWRGRQYRFIFSWAADAGIEWGSLYLNGSQRAEILGFEKLRSMEAAWPAADVRFPEELGPALGWNHKQTPQVAGRA